MCSDPISLEELLGSSVYFQAFEKRMTVWDEGKRTLLCRWIVYSLATTSAIADRVFFPPVVFFGWVLGLSFAISKVCRGIFVSLHRIAVTDGIKVESLLLSMAIERWEGICRYY